PGGHRHLEAVFTVPEFQPVLVQDAAAVLDTDQCTALFGFRQAHGSGITDGIFGPVGVERQAAGAFAAFFAGAAGPAGPVHIKHFTGAVAAVRIADAQQVATPFRVIDAQRPFAL